MIWTRKEGDTIRQGFNFYNLSDPDSIGGCLRVGSLVFRLRWSKRTKKLFANCHKINHSAMEQS
jgi:hypothetical protein